MCGVTEGPRTCGRRRPGEPAAGESVQAVLQAQHAAQKAVFRPGRCRCGTGASTSQLRLAHGRAEKEAERVLLRSAQCLLHALCWLLRFRGTPAQQAVLQRLMLIGRRRRRALLHHLRLVVHCGAGVPPLLLILRSGSNTAFCYRSDAYYSAIQPVSVTVSHAKVGGDLYHVM